MKRFLVLSLLFTALVASRAVLADVVQEGEGYTFRLDTSTWTDRPTKVNLAGDFNGWSTTATPMSDEDGDNVWTVTLTELAEGKRLYKFVVNGDRWMVDPTGDKELEEDDGHGGKNSGFIVGPDIRTAPPPRPNHIATEFVLHDPASIEDAQVVDEGKVRLRVRAQAGDVQVVEVIPHVWPIGTNEDAKSVPIELTKVATERGLDVFGGIVDLGATVLTDDDQKLAAEQIRRDGIAARVPPAGVAQYHLRLIDGSSTVDFFDPEMAKLDVKGADTTPFARPLNATFDIPDWSKSAVWYQIFPERFRNGDPANDPGQFAYENLVPWNGNWWSALPGEAPGEQNFYQGAGNVWKRRYGGDIRGIREKLPYLRELGVTAIYLNPVFEGESMHKYDTADFRHIDDNFGVLSPQTAALAGKRPQEVAQVRYQVYPPRIEGETDDPSTWQWSESDRLFLEFLEDAHAQGFKVIIDGVFNHVGRAHPFFIDVLQNGKRSRYADWFEITDWGDEANWRPMADPFEVHGKPGGIQWAAWDGHNGHLPVFKKDGELGLAPGPREHIFAITRRWTNPDGDPTTRDGVDGWRLDVPGDIPHPFWRDWRIVVKESNPDAYITGEIWNWAQPWLQGDQFDAVMNYQFAMAAQDFFIDRRTAITPSQFDERLKRLTEAYPWSIVLAQQNLMGSHDTDRLASMFVNPDRPYDGANRPQDNAQHFDGPPYSARKPSDQEWARFKQLVAFQHAFVGAPMTYYGDEAGMWGPDDPSNRQPFPWPDRAPYSAGVGFSSDIFTFFQRVIAIRNALPALQRGQFRSVLADDERNLYAFARELDGQIVYVVLNRGPQPQALELPVEPGAYLDHMDEWSVEIVHDDADPAARPAPRAIADPTTARDGQLRLRLQPYGVAVLVKQ